MRKDNQVALAFVALLSTPTLAHAVDICDARDLYEKIATAVPPQTKFESDAVYRQRSLDQLKASGIQTKAIICEVAAVTAGTVGTEDYTFYTVGYNANAGAIEYNAKMFLPNSVTETHVIREYPAGNAFGAHATVTEMERISYRPSFQWNYPIAVSIPLDPKYAESAWDNLSIAVRFDLSYPWTTDETRLEKPTIDDPREIHQTIRTVQGVPTHILLVNKATGEIIWEAPVRKH